MPLLSRSRRRLAVLAAALLALPLVAAGPAGPAAAATTAPDRWADQPPAGAPLAQSDRFSAVSFTGRYATYQNSDTWYPAEAADGTLYSPFMDGLCNGVGVFGAGDPAGLGSATIRGDDPLALSISDCRLLRRDKAGYLGRYASASVVKDGVWYYGTYVVDRQTQPGAPRDCNNYCTVGGFVGFDTSTDGGRTWTRAPTRPSLFGETTAGGNRVKLGVLHAVDFGRNMQHSPDGKIYLVGHGGGGSTSVNSWVGGDDIYLVRVDASPAAVNDPSAYEFYAGSSGGTPVWSRRLADLRPLLSWPGRLGSATITYNAPLRTYLMWVTTPEDGVNTTGDFDSMLLESDSLTGPWRMVHYLPEFGTQAYFLNTPSKFISADGRRMWLWYSANYCCGGSKSLPAGSGYQLVVRELTLDTGGPTRLEAERARLSGGASVGDFWSGYTGKSFVEGYLAQGARTEFDVWVPAAGARPVTLRYANGGFGTGRLTVAINGTRVVQTALPTTGGWDRWADRAETLPLRAGWNTVRYAYEPGDTGWVNLDHIRL